ncbi:MAG TPA: palindromic element RPE4 domain-containing protein [Rickettsia endosymbiont of Columbicola hoogstraali]|nr:palindromic element RPE4 domain-containing protein [Rickettsia endosymbiont of Columbicola hoogstraali]
MSSRGLSTGSSKECRYQKLDSLALY